MDVIPAINSPSSCSPRCFEPSTNCPADALESDRKPAARRMSPLSTTRAPPLGNSLNRDTSSTGSAGISSGSIRFILTLACLSTRTLRQASSNTVIINSTPTMTIQSRIVNSINSKSLICPPDQLAAIAAASSTSTDTKRETPGSCIVTPIN